MNTVLWIGPVWPALIAPAVPTDWAIRTIDDHITGGNGSEAYKRWALGLGNDPLSKLAPDAREIVIAGFSRGHGAIEVLLGLAAGRRDARVTGLLALDSYYSAWGVKEPKLGFLAWCQIALQNGLPAIFTTSTHHPAQYPSSSESIKPLAQALSLTETRPLSGVPEPARTIGRGTVFWLDYEARFRHEDHAIKLGQPFLSIGAYFRPRFSYETTPAAFASTPSVQAPPRAQTTATPTPATTPMQATPTPALPPKQATSMQSTKSSSLAGWGVALGILALAGGAYALKRSHQ